MKMRNLTVRCFAERSEGVWVAYCVEFGLGAQADTFEAAKAKLEEQLRDLTPDEAMMLLEQGSPLSLQARYWFVRSVHWAVQRLGRKPERKVPFKEPSPVALGAC